MPKAAAWERWNPIYSHFCAQFLAQQEMLFVIYNPAPMSHRTCVLSMNSSSSLRPCWEWVSWCRAVPKHLYKWHFWGWISQGTACTPSLPFCGYSQRGAVCYPFGNWAGVLDQRTNTFIFSDSQIILLGSFTTSRCFWWWDIYLAAHIALINDRLIFLLLN